MCLEQPASEISIVLSLPNTLININISPSLPLPLRVSSPPPLRLIFFFKNRKLFLGGKSSNFLLQTDVFSVLTFSFCIFSPPRACTSWGNFLFYLFALTQQLSLLVLPGRLRFCLFKFVFKQCTLAQFFAFNSINFPIFYKLFDYYVETSQTVTFNINFL